MASARNAACGCSSRSDWRSKNSRVRPPRTRSPPSAPWPRPRKWWPLPVTTLLRCPMRPSLGAGSVRKVQRRTTAVVGGENAGRTLRDANAVRQLTTLGAWEGAAHRFAIEPPAAGEGVAVLVQAADGRMLGAAAVKSDDKT